MLARSAAAASRSCLRGLSTSAAPTGVVMLNMGGPGSLDGERDGVKPFLKNLFRDSEIIPLGPLQDSLSSFISTRRTPKIKDQYSQIGGKSPIGDWTRAQGKALEAKLDKLSPDTAPHKAYTAFRYAPPYAEDALRQMAADGVRRAVAFSQYPHFSCTTSGSSYNNLWREVMRLGMEKDITWSLIDRWPTFPTYIRALTQRVEEGLATVPAEQRHSTVIIFTAHSVPMKVVNRGDQYVAEVASTVSAVMSQLWQQQASPPAQRNPYVLAWQSKVGFLPWMGPSTSDVIKGLARQGHTSVLMVPVAFTSDHIETLFEIDIEYAEEAEEAGITTFARAPSLNDSDTLTTAQAELVAEHLAAGQLCTTQYTLNCAGCVNPACRTILNPAGGPGSYSKLRDSYGTPGQVPTWPSEAEKAAIQSTVGRTP